MEDPAMIIYGHPMSQHVRRIQMLCEEISTPYSFQPIALDKGEQYTEEFLEKNPNGKVPVVDDNGFVLWESHAIMRYIADKNKARKWYPTEPKARAEVEKWLDWNHTRLNPEVSTIVMNTIIFGDKGDKHAVEMAKQSLEKILPVLERTLQSQDYLSGPEPMISDLSVVSTISHLEMCNCDLSGYPAIDSWYKNLKRRPSFTKTALAKTALDA
jgi:glutathione S-transferase